MDTVIDGLARANEQLAIAGVQAQHLRLPSGEYEYRYLVPLADGRMVSFAARERPSYEIGGVLKSVRRLKQKATAKLMSGVKRVAKKLAKPAAVLSGVAALKAAARVARGKPLVKSPKRAKRDTRVASATRAKGATRAARAMVPKRAGVKKRSPMKEPVESKESLVPVPEEMAMDGAPEMESEEGAPVSAESQDDAAEVSQDDAAEASQDDGDDSDASQDEGAEVGALLSSSRHARDAADEQLRAAGVVGQAQYRDGVMRYRYLVPMADGRRVSFEYAVRPVVEIGAGRIARKIKKGLKKVAKSKAFGKLLKAATFVSSVVPGGQALGAGLAMAAKAQKMVAKARKAVKGAKGLVRGGRKAVGKGAKLLARSSAGVPAGVSVTLPSGRRAVVTFV